MRRFFHRVGIHARRGLTGMSESNRHDLKSGPLGNFSQAYFGGLDTMVKSYEPALKGVSRWNLELAGLMARRAQAWLAIPSLLTQCKTPVDIFNAQGKFWQAAASDYADGSKRLTAVFSSAAAIPKLNGIQPRDYITFAEPQETSAAPKLGDRKAA
jgi:hypothetical protein